MEDPSPKSALRRPGPSSIPAMSSIDSSRRWSATGCTIPIRECGRCAAAVHFPANGTSRTHGDGGDDPGPDRGSGQPRGEDSMGGMSFAGPVRGRRRARHAGVDPRGPRSPPKPMRDSTARPPLCWPVSRAGRREPDEVVTTLAKFLRREPLTYQENTAIALGILGSSATLGRLRAGHDVSGGGRFRSDRGGVVDGRGPGPDRAERSVSPRNDHSARGCPGIQA